MQISPSESSPNLSNQSERMFKAGVVVGLVVLLIVAAVGMVLQQNLANEAKQRAKSLEDRVAALEAETALPEKEVAKDKYQSVFLTNGQVYFGKITQITKDTIKFEGIFYLKDEGGTLAKLGDELHAPEDMMILERKQVLFWENLKADGKVAKSIADYKKAH